MNGYKNFETWNCYNWLTVDESSVFKWEKAAKEALENGGGDKDEAAIILSKQIKEAVESEAPELEPGLYIDLLNAALQEIDYVEVAAAFIE